MISLRKGCQGKPRGVVPSLLLVVILILFSPITLAANELQLVEISKDDKGNTLLSLTLMDNAVVTDFKKQKNTLSISLKNTSIINGLVGDQYVKDMGKTVVSVTVEKRDDDAWINIETQGDFSYDYYQASNVLTVEVSPLAIHLTTKSKKSSAPSKSSLISINFQDIPVRSVLQMVAEHNGFNLVVSDSVSGSLTLRLDDVPWQKALDTILKVKGLDKRSMGNILLVAPKTELDEQERRVLEQRRQERELASLRSDVIQINYADAESLKYLLDGGDDDDDEGVSLLSERGSVAVDPRTNSLVIKDLPDNIEIIRSLIAILDIPVKQVEIEARIVSVDEGTLDDIGVRWGVSNTNGSFTTGGSIEGNTSGDTTVNTKENTGDDNDTSGIDNMLNVNFGAGAGAATIAFQVANLGKNLMLDLELSALQTESRAEIISSPRLITTNKRAAYIEQGTELPYLEASSSGAASVAFKKAVLSLKVTPQITPDNKLVLDIEVTQDKPAGSVVSGTGEAMAISTQRISTQVLVNDGETIVLGGIYQHAIEEKVDKVPLLGDIPGLGRLFRRDYEQVAKRELLIFVTPRILTQ